MGTYRVSHLVWDLGLVDCDFECSPVCPVLLGLVGIWQKRLCNWARWSNIQIKFNPNPGARAEGTPCKPAVT